VTTPQTDAQTHMYAAQKQYPTTRPPVAKINIAIANRSRTQSRPKADVTPTLEHNADACSLHYDHATYMRSHFTVIADVDEYSFRKLTAALY